MPMLNPSDRADVLFVKRAMIFFGFETAARDIETRWASKSPRERYAVLSAWQKRLSHA